MQIAHACYPEYSASIRGKYYSNLALTTLTFGRVLLLHKSLLTSILQPPGVMHGDGNVW